MRHTFCVEMSLSVSSSESDSEPILHLHTNSEVEDGIMQLFASDSKSFSSPATEEAKKTKKPDSGDTLCTDKSKRNSKGPGKGLGKNKKQKAPLKSKSSVVNDGEQPGCSKAKKGKNLLKLVKPKVEMLNFLIY